MQLIRSFFFIPFEFNWNFRTKLIFGAIKLVSNLFTGHYKNDTDEF